MKNKVHCSGTDVFVVALGTGLANYEWCCQPEK